MNKKIMEQITQISAELRLSGLGKEIEAVITDGLKQNASYEQVILPLLTKELDQRKVNRDKARMRNADFPQLKYLQDIIRAELPEDGRTKLAELETLDFIKDGQNIILGGSPGTGKSHIAIGLGIKACMDIALCSHRSPNCLPKSGNATLHAPFGHWKAGLKNMIWSSVMNSAISLLTAEAQKCSLTISL